MTDRKLWWENWKTGLLWSFSIGVLVDMCHALWIEGPGLHLGTTTILFILALASAWARTFTPRNPTV